MTRVKAVQYVTPQACPNSGEELADARMFPKSGGGVRTLNLTNGGGGNWRWYEAKQREGWPPCVL